jgi:hypothetical protein
MSLAMRTNTSGLPLRGRRGEVRAPLLGLVAGAALALCGCSGPGGDTTALVERGDAQACAAADVYTTLRTLLTTKVDLNSSLGDMSPIFGQQLQALKQASLQFDATTLDAVDKATRSVNCSSEVSGKVGDQAVTSQRVTYRIQPSAGAGSVVVTVQNADDVQARLMQAAVLATRGALGPADASTPAGIPSASAPPPSSPSTVSGAPPSPVNATTEADQPAQDPPTHTRFGDLSTNDALELLLNGRRVQPVIRGNYSLTLGDVYPFGDRDLVVATDNGSGGAACLGMIRIIIVDANGARSPGEYGTCAEIGDIKRVGDRLVTTMPGFEGPGESEAAQVRAHAERHTFVFTPDGRATDNGQPQRPS